MISKQKVTGTRFSPGATITVTSATNCPAIGNASNRFTGTYDGDGKTITGLTQVTTSSNSGFFGYIGADGTVINSRNFATVSGRICIGGIVGTGDTTVTVRYCISLSTRVINTTNSVYAGRISGTQSLTMTGNKARTDLLLGPSSQTTPVTTGTSSNKDGENVPTNSPQATVVFNYWSTTIWNIIITGNLSTSVLSRLNSNMQTPAPTLPPSP